MYQLSFGQINFEPYTNHGYQPYTATISGSGTIYYTTDGTEPTVNSSSGINSINITITQNTVIKAKLASSQIFTQTYYFGEMPLKVVYFKPPASWNVNNVCSYMNFIQPQYLIDFFPPGNHMTAVCEGWYKTSFTFYKAIVDFNNCVTGPAPYYQGVQVTTEDTVFYDFTDGPISNPPACLLAVNDPSEKVAIVKVFPNPVQDYLNIQSDKNILAYEILDETGRLIIKGDFKDSKINISQLKTGVYFINLKSLSNDKNIVKFIKK